MFWEGDRIFCWWCCDIEFNWFVLDCEFCGGGVWWYDDEEHDDDDRKLIAVFVNGLGDIVPLLFVLLIPLYDRTKLLDVVFTERFSLSLLITFSTFISLLTLVWIELIECKLYSLLLWCCIFLILAFFLLKKKIISWSL